MFPFVETIKICDGKAENLSYHEARMNTTRRELFGIESPANLSSLLASATTGKSGIRKCRIEYGEQIGEIEILPYSTPVIRNLMLIHDDTIRYDYKSTDRDRLNQLHAEAVGCSDALIVRNGLITDTTFCNVAFFDGYHWFTPLTPLLKGTKRAQLLDLGMLIERDIPACMVHEFQLVMLFNSMNEFGSILLPTHEIYRSL
ncbi:MAG: aminotransferase class IV [Bacteroidales bacterium]